MSLPIESWPIFQDFNSSVELPEETKCIFSIATTSQTNELTEIDCFSSPIHLLRARIIKLKISDPRYSLRNMNIPLTANNLQEARLYWVKRAQISIKEDLENGLSDKGCYRKLNVKCVNGVHLAVGRLEAWNEFTYNKKELVILPASHKYSELYATYIHNQAHRGVSADIAKIRSEYWIVGI